jgi:hypothetical protein
MPYDERRLNTHRDAMTRGDAVVVTLTTHDETKAPGTIRTQTLDADARRRRARKWLLTCLLLAPVSMVCPPHLPWPILVVTIGVVGAWLRQRRSELVLGGEGTCPKCKAFQILEAGNAEFPMAHFCSECGERSLVRPAHASC